MTSTRHNIAAVVSLVVGGLAVLLQYIVTPLKGDMKGAEIVSKVAAHHGAMGLTVFLDLLVLLAAPAFLYLGALALARTSKLAATATVLLFGSFLVSVPAIDGFDGLAFFAGTEPDGSAMAHVLDTWQKSAWFSGTVLPYLLLNIVGSILLAIALGKAKTVPTWVAVATGVWPIAQTAGYAAGITPLAVAGCAILFVTWVACAYCLVRPRTAAVAPRALVTA